MARRTGIGWLGLAAVLTVATPGIRAEEPLGQGIQTSPEHSGLTGRRPAALTPSAAEPVAPTRPDPRFSPTRLRVERVVEPPDFRPALDLPTISNARNRRAPYGVCYGMNLFAMVWFQESVQPLLSGREEELRPHFGVAGPITPRNLAEYRLRRLQRAGGVKARAWAEHFQEWQFEESHRAKPQGFPFVFAAVEESLADPSVQAAMLGIEPAGGQWAHNVLAVRLLEGELTAPGLLDEERRVLFVELFDPNFADRDPALSAGFGIFYFPDASPPAASFSWELLHFYNDTEHPLQPERVLGDWQLTFEPTFEKKALADRPSTWIWKRIRWRKPPPTEDRSLALKVGNEHYLFGWEGEKELSPPVPSP